MKHRWFFLFFSLCLAVGVGCEKLLGSPDSPTSELAGDRSEGVGGSGFVWKPRSESNGRLVVLLPSSFAGKVSGASIQRGSERVESGVFVGNTNGNRPTFRFSQWGGAYGNDLTVVATLSGGGRATWSIPNGARRVS